MQTLDRFQFQQDAVVNDQVQAIAAVQVQSFVVHRQRSLPLEFKLSFRELGAQTCFVRRFQESGTEMPLHLDQRADHRLCSIPKSSDLPIFLCHPPFIFIGPHTDSPASAS